jgi:hypothetical protein
MYALAGGNDMSVIRPDRVFWSARWSLDMSFSAVRVPRRSFAPVCALVCS